MSYAEKVQRGVWLQDIFSKAGEDKLRAYIFYFGLPLFLFFTLAPGLLISIPPAVDCDTGVSKPFAPSRVTYLNAIVHAIVFTLILILLFRWGAHRGIVFPFCSTILKQI